jgi:pimeloyl-ACP methyl ester carboxylesterase
MNEHPQRGTTPLGIDRIVTLAINGSAQQIRMCAERTGLRPILIVQAGPGLPLLNEVAKFRRHLHLESDFLVTYWDQRGCGIASQHDAIGVSLRQQVDDLRTVLQWLYNETKQTVIVFGISLGATIALQAVAHDPDRATSVIVISPDADTAGSDAAVDAFLHEQSLRAKSRRLDARLKKLGQPPYIDSARFQLRGRLLADLGAIEHGKKFNAVLKDTLFGMIGTYGPFGTIKALRNMGLVQRTLLPQLVSLDLFASPPRVSTPVHYVFGEQDALTPAAIARELPVAIAAPRSTAVRVPDAGHMVHFDQPEVVRSIVVSAANDTSS